MDNIYHDGTRVADELGKFGHKAMRIIKWEDVSQLSSSTQVIRIHECTSHNVTMSINYFEKRMSDIIMIRCEELTK